MAQVDNNLVAVFDISGSLYGLVLTSVQEILPMPSITPLPKAPAIIRGIVNIRGTAVPVLDIRARFRLPSKSPVPTDHLVVARAGQRPVALCVDRVLDLRPVASSAIQDADSITPGAEYLAGVARCADGLILIHDLCTFLAEAEANDLDAALAHHATATP